MPNIRIDSRKQTAEYKEIQEKVHAGIALIESSTPYKVCAITLGTKQKATLEAALIHRTAGGDQITQINGRPVAWLEGSWILFTCGQDETALTLAT